MQRDIYLDGVLSRRYDDDARIVYDFTTEPPTARPYTAAENAVADGVPLAEAEAAAAAGVARDETEAATRRTIEEALGTALAGMQAIIDTPNSTINGSPASYIKDIARANRRLIRLTTRRLDGTS